MVHEQEGDPVNQGRFQVYKAAAAIKAIKADNPEAYAAVGKHHADALARLEAAAEG